MEPHLGVTRARASLSMAILPQLVTAAIAMIVGFTVFRDRAWSLSEVLEATLSLVLIIIVFNRLLPFVFFSRTKGSWLARWVLLLRGLIYLVLPVTLVLGFCQSVTALRASTRRRSRKLRPKRSMRSLKRDRKRALFRRAIAN